MTDSTLLKTAPGFGGALAGARREVFLLSRRRWPTRGAAVVAGVLAAFAQPPWGFVPGLLGYGLMFLLADRAPGRRAAFVRGWQVGVGYFIVSLWWLAEPFQVDAKNQGWMAPFAVLFTAMFMALFWGAAGAAFRALKGRSPLRVLLFAAALAGAEWLRGHILTGFPWDPPGSSWLAGGAMSQIASVVGIYGLTWLTLAAAAALFVAGERRVGLATAIGAVAAVAGFFGFGAARLARPLPAPTGPLVRIVQADVRQETKYDQNAFTGILDRYIQLTTRSAAHTPDIVIWPEGAIPASFEDYLGKGTWTYNAIGAALAPGQTLILGGYRYGEGARDVAGIFNSQAVILRTADALKIEALYDKYRLVPFGEFMPLDGLASRLGIKALVHVGDGFSAGARPAPLAIPGLPTMQPLICYEALYSGFTRAGSRRTGLRAAWIVNISNDAWFGTGIGPRQHLNLASYRAIEEGLPMIRATPTGISGVIDARGRLIPGEFLGEGAMGVIDARLPSALKPTLFDLWGDGAFFAMLLVSLVGAAIPPAPGALGGVSGWSLPWAGGCRCGQTRIEVTAPPVIASACHCEGCQKMTASAYALTLTLPASGLQIVQGEPVIGGLHGATRHFFCPHCLSWMFTRPAEGEYVNLRPSMLDDHGWFVPFIEVFTQARLPWAETGALYSYATFPGLSDYRALARNFATKGARPALNANCHSLGLRQ